MDLARHMICAWWCVVRGDRERLAGRYALAEGWALRGLALARRSRRLRHLLEVQLLNQLGMIRKYQGQYDRSLHAYRGALRIARRHFPRRDGLFASVYHNLAGLEHARERYLVAEPFARMGLSLRERSLGGWHLEVARDLAGLAAILDGQGRHLEAESMYRRALRILERRGRSARREIAHTLANLAACLHLMGRPEAAAVARRAASMQISLLGANHPETRQTLANVAAIERSGSAMQAD